jgi:hypothetical protein
MNLKKRKILVISQLTFFTSVLLSAYIRYLLPGFYLSALLYFYLIILVFHIIVQESYLVFLANHSQINGNKYKLSFLSSGLLFLITLFMCDCDDQNCQPVFNVILNFIGIKGGTTDTYNGSFIWNLLLLLFIIFLNIWVIRKIFLLNKKE